MDSPMRTVLGPLKAAWNTVTFFLMGGFPSLAMVMVAIPGAIPWTTPLLFTDAMLESLELHVSPETWGDTVSAKDDSANREVSPRT